MDESVSVILPVYNVEAILGGQVRAILDVLSDIVQRLEILIIDDGSNDGTEEIAWQLTLDYPQVGYVRLPQRLGSQQAIQTGCKASAGDYLMIHNGQTPLDIEQMAQLWISRRTVSPPDNTLGQQESTAMTDPGWLRQLIRWGNQFSLADRHQSWLAGLRLLRRNDFSRVVREPDVKAAPSGWQGATTSGPAGKVPQQSAAQMHGQHPIAGTQSPRVSKWVLPRRTSLK